MGQNAPKKIYNSNYIVLFEKNAFRFDVGPRKVPEVPRFKIESEGIFLIKYYIITILKKIGAFRPIFNKVKNGFHIVF